MGDGEGFAGVNFLRLAVDLHNLRAAVSVAIKGDGVGLHRAANAGAVFIIIGVGLGDGNAAARARVAVCAVTHGVAILIGGVTAHFAVACAADGANCLFGAGCFAAGMSGARFAAVGADTVFVGVHIDPFCPTEVLIDAVIHCIVGCTADDYG